VDYYNITSAGQVMHERLAISLATNPNVTNTPKEILLRSGTSAFYLMLMGDAFTGVAPKKCVGPWQRQFIDPVVVLTRLALQIRADFLQRGTPSDC
jgi:hypothetical protein